MKTPEPRDTTLWLEGVPNARAATVAAAGATIALGVFAYTAARTSGGAAPLEAAIACVAVAIVLVVPLRLGSPLAVAAAVAFFAVDAAAGRLGGGVTARTVLLAFSLLATLACASLVRLAIRRRDVELALARDAIGELTRRDRITEQLSGGREPTWLDAELARARRYHHQLALVLVQPDGIDDTASADTVLAEAALESVAQVIGGEFRATDVALRYGSGTFSLILPETTVDGARLAAERLRLMIAARVAAEPGRPLTVSTGIASFPRDATTNDELVAVAGRALERARTLGGNRTVCASADGDVPPGWTLAETTV